MGQAHNAVKDGPISRKVFGFNGRYAKSVTRKVQAGDNDVVCDDITLHGSGAVCNLEGLL